MLRAEFEPAIQVFSSAVQDRTATHPFGNLHLLTLAC
jgi:hypothetical protein